MEHGELHNAPWHLRQAGYSHYRTFGHLTELHRMTEAWIRELQIARPSHNLDRGLGREITENLWMLENPSERGLDSLLDDTEPGDVLDRLEKTIWSVQAYTLSQLLDRTSAANDRRVLDSTLEQISWKLGRECAERRWAKLPTELRSDVKRTLLAFGDTPFGSCQTGLSYLLLRGTREEGRIELLHCPHLSPISDVHRVADELCASHGHWARGFAYGLNHRLQVTCLQQSKRGPARCRQHWYLAPG